MATGKDILNKAISHLGETGSPTWSWWNKSVQNWGTGWAWCCAFVNKVFVECGAGNLFYGGGKTASVGIADNWFYSHCKWVKYSEAQSGDIVIFTWYPTGAGNTRSGREKSHIGIWEKRISDSTFSAIEGNTGNSPAHVMRRTRSRNYIYAIYRPNYSATTPMVKNNRALQVEFNGTDAQLWKTVDAGNGYVRIVNKAGAYLTAYSSDKQITAMYAIEKTDRQLWKFVESPVGGHRIVSKTNENYCLDVTNGTLKARANTLLHVLNTKKVDMYAQSWYLQHTYNDEEYCALVNAKSFWVVDGNPSGIKLDGKSR